jgi:Tfp pilus assembly protein PilF
LISGLDRAQTVHLFAYCTMTVRIRSPVVGAISLARRLSFSKASRFICKFHLGILLEDLRVSLAKHLRHPLIRYASCTQPRGIGGAKIVDAEVWNLRPPKSLAPNRLERGLMPSPISIAGEQEQTVPGDGHLPPKGFNGQWSEGDFGGTVRSLRVRDPDDRVGKVHLVLLHRSQFPVSTEFVRVQREPQRSDVAPLPPIDVNVPPEARKEFDKASEKLEQKNWADAKPHLERAIAIYPKYALAYNNLALTYLNLNQGEKAVETFRTAAELDEHLPQANLYLGRFYYDNKDYKQAEPFLLRASDGAPKNPQILLALANTQMKNGELDQSLLNAQKVHSLPDHKQFAMAHLIAAQILSDRGKTQDAAEEYRRFLREVPESPMADRVKDALSKLEGK